jgi:hypothetical protein
MTTDRLTPRALLRLLNAGTVHVDRDLLVVWHQAAYTRHPATGRWERIIPLAPWAPAPSKETV